MDGDGMSDSGSDIDWQIEEQARERCAAVFRVRAADDIVLWEGGQEDMPHGGPPKSTHL